MASTDCTYDLFISYSHTDRDWVRNHLDPALTDAGRTICIDRRDFGLGALKVTESVFLQDDTVDTLPIETKRLTGSLVVAIGGLTATEAA